MHAHPHRSGCHMQTAATPNPQYRGEKWKVWVGNELFIRLTVKALDSEPTHCFRAAVVVLTNMAVENKAPRVQSMNVRCDPPADRVLMGGLGALQSISTTLRCKWTRRANWTHSFAGNRNNRCRFLSVHPATDEIKQPRNGGLVFILKPMIWKFT